MRNKSKETLTADSIAKIVVLAAAFYLLIAIAPSFFPGGAAHAVINAPKHASERAR